MGFFPGEVCPVDRGYIYFGTSLKNGKKAAVFAAESGHTHTHTDTRAADEHQTQMNLFRAKHDEAYAYVASPGKKACGVDRGRRMLKRRQSTGHQMMSLAKKEDLDARDARWWKWFWKVGPPPFGCLVDARVDFMAASPNTLGTTARRGGVGTLHFEQRPAFRVSSIVCVVRSQRRVQQQ